MPLNAIKSKIHLINQRVIKTGLNGASFATRVRALRLWISHHFADVGKIKKARQIASLRNGRERRFSNQFNKNSQRMRVLFSFGHRVNPYRHRVSRYILARVAPAWIILVIPVQADAIGIEHDNGCRKRALAIE